MTHRMTKHKLARVITAGAERGPSDEGGELRVPVGDRRQPCTNRGLASIGKCSRNQSQAEWRANFSSRPVRPAETGRTSVAAAGACVDVLGGAKPACRCSRKQVLKVRNRRDSCPWIFAVRQRKFRYQSRRGVVIHARL